MKHLTAWTVAYFATFLILFGNFLYILGFTMGRADADANLYANLICLPINCLITGFMGRNVMLMWENRGRP